MDVEQQIEQPMFTTAGEADSLAVVLPVSEKSTALVTVAPTSVTVTEVATVSTADLDKHIRATMGTCGQLVAERDRVTAEIRRQAKDVLHPALIEMRKRYNNPGARTDLLPGITTFQAYLLSIGFCSSILRVWDHRQRQKELEGLLPSNGQKRIGSGSSSRPAGSLSPVVTDEDPDDAVTGDATSALVNLGFSRTDAKQAIEQVLRADAKLVNDFDGLLRNALGGLSEVKPTSGNDEAGAIIAEFEQAVTAADSSTVTNNDNSTSESSVAIEPTEPECADVRPAEEGLLFAAPPVAEPEKVAAAPDKLDPSVSELNAERDWKQVLVELLQVLEQSGDRLPLVVLAEKRKIESLLAGKGPGRPVGARSSTTTKRYTKVMKLNQEGNRR